MSTWIGRLLLAGWFIGMISVAVWNGRGAEAQATGNQSLFLPLMHKPDMAAQAYLGLVAFDHEDSTVDFYTVNGNGTGWAPLRLGAAADISFDVAWAWSPDGTTFIHFNDPEISDTPGVWLVPLSTRTPRLLTEESGWGFRWSADSRFVAFQGATRLYLYDLQQDQLTTLMPSDPRLLRWSPDGRILNWVDYDPNGNSVLWVWNVIDGYSVVVYTGNISWNEPMGSEYFWSPDSSQLYFNLHTEDGQHIWRTTATGAPATEVLADATMRGWVDGGARILVERDALYLAQPDGSDLTFFSERHGERVLVSPPGDVVLMGNYYNGTGTFVQKITETQPTSVYGCRGITFTWRADGQRFGCSNHVVGSAFGTTIGDTTTTPETILPILPTYFGPQFLPRSTNLIGVDRFVEGYPMSFRGSSLYNYDTGVYKQITAPDGAGGRVLEWRYTP